MLFMTSSRCLQDHRPRHGDEPDPVCRAIALLERLSHEVLNGHCFSLEEGKHGPVVQIFHLCGGLTPTHQLLALNCCLAYENLCAATPPALERAKNEAGGLRQEAGK